MVIVGAVTSGKVIVTVAVALDEILPAESLAQAYAVFVPAELKVMLEGALLLQRLSVAVGAVELSLTI